jgi:hypothetical protein
MMLKLPFALLVLVSPCLVGSCLAQPEEPLTQLQGTSRLLMVFSPDSNNINFKRQLGLIEHHVYELTERNTVVVPVAFVSNGAEDRFSGENLRLGTDQAAARARFHVQPGEFLVVVLNADGTERMRSGSPIDIHELTARLDIPPRRLH